MKILFSERCRQLRKEAGLTQTRLAAQLGMTQRKLSYLESGQSEPDLETLWRLADRFDVSVDYLFERCETAEYLRANPTSCFAERLAILISESGRNKRSLALQWKIEPSAITKWLQRQRLPKPDTVFQLADYFACSMDYLLGRSDVR